MPPLLLSPPTGAQIAFTFCTCIGDRYIWGADPATNNPNPVGEDCSGGVSWSHRRNGVNLMAGTWLQAAWLREHGRQIPIEEAIRTPGAIVFFFSSNVWMKGQRPKESHVVLSCGNKLRQDIEAHNTARGVGLYPMDKVRWTCAFLHPDVNYGPVAPSPVNPTPITPPAPAPIDWKKVGQLAAAEWLPWFQRLEVPIGRTSPPGPPILLLQNVLNLVRHSALPLTSTYDDATAWAVATYERDVNTFRPGSIVDANMGLEFSNQAKFWLDAELDRVAKGLE